MRTLTYNHLLLVILVIQNRSHYSNYIIPLEKNVLARKSL